jgi:hypothetical protein
VIRNTWNDELSVDSEFAACVKCQERVMLKYASLTCSLTCVHDEAILDICGSKKGITAEFVTREQVAHNQEFYVTTCITIVVYIMKMGGAKPAPHTTANPTFPRKTC